MALNYIWISFFFVALIVGLLKFLGAHLGFMPDSWEVGANQVIKGADKEVFNAIVKSTFDYAKTGFTIALGLTGVLSLWMGLLRVGELGGAVQVLTRIFQPFFLRIFPDVPKGHPSLNSVVMNFTANMLGLDNAATPAGLKAMEGLQELNPKKEEASRSQVMFLVLNTSGLTLIPVSVLTLRAEVFAKHDYLGNPANVFIPILIATFVSTLVGLSVTSLLTKVKWDSVVWAYIVAMSIVIFGGAYWLIQLPPEQLNYVSTTLASTILFGIIISFLGMAARKKINIYEGFIEGAKDGFGVAIKIIPYLVAMLVAIGVFRTSGAMDLLTLAFDRFFAFLGMNTDFVGAIPTALMKPLSGGGARALMIDAMNSVEGNPNNFVGNIASTIQGTTETTFYVLAVYFGSVGIKRSNLALTCGLIADLAGIIAAIILGYYFFA